MRLFTDFRIHFITSGGSLKGSRITHYALLQCRGVIAVVAAEPAAAAPTTDAAVVVVDAVQINARMSTP